MLKPEDIMRGCEGLVAVWLSVEPRHEEEFNAWYRFEHLDDMIGLEGFYSGRRYASDWLYPKYLALYETDNEKAETGPAFTHMINTSDLLVGAHAHLLRPGSQTRQLQAHWPRHAQRQSLRKRTADAARERVT